jgi:hypothetical protein
MNLPSVLLGFLLSSALALAFHLLRGGRVTRMLLYLLAAWISFGVGHLAGEWLPLRIWRLGEINMLSAGGAAVLGLLLTSFLAMPDGGQARRKRGRDPDRRQSE